MNPMKKLMLPIALIFSAILTFTNAVPAYADLTLEIIGGGSNQIPIAVAPFQATDHVSDSNSISAVVEADLKRCGLFKTLDTRGLSAIPHTPAEINFSDWATIQAQVLVIGSVENLQGNRMRVTFRVFDVLRQNQLMGMEFAVSQNQGRATAHKIADLIYQQLIGEPGDFSTKIAYVSKTGNQYLLQVADADGFGAQTVVSSKEPLISPSWSPDGNKLAYVSFERKKPVIYVQSLITGRREVLANFKGNNSAPAWSPDGSKLAIVLTYNANSQVHIINADGSGLRKLSDNLAIETEPAWSADGNSIYFTSNRGGVPQIYVMPARGGEAKRVTFDGKYNVSPHISPKGNMLTFIKQVPQGFRVAQLDLQTGLSQVLGSHAEDESPSYSPNGRMILYASRIAGKGTLVAVSNDGKIKQVFSDSSGDIREPSWGPRVK
jgi:TolB protein